MRVGVVCDDRYHPADIVKDGLNALPTQDVEWDFVADTSGWSREQMDGYDVIILARSNCKSTTDYSPWLTAEIQQDFQDYVNKGRGLLAIHSGTVGYRDEVDFRALIGGGFRHHPESCPVQVEYVGDGAQSGVGLNPFTVFDEHYFMEMYNDDIHIFMTSTSNGETYPAGWYRLQGAGRVCVLTPGHYRDVWLQPDYQKTIDNALNWCGGRSDALFAIKDVS